MPMCRIFREYRIEEFLYENSDKAFNILRMPKYLK